MSTRQIWGIALAVALGIWLAFAAIHASQPMPASASYTLPQVTTTIQPYCDTHVC